jgi:uncharacterized protein (TIGR00299 family) protein
MKVAYIDMFSGASGDMLLGAFIDAGVSLNEIKTELSKIPINFNITVKKEKDVIMGTSVLVKSSDKKERMLDDVILLLDESELEKNVKNQAKNVFMKIGRVEGKLHGEKKVHFHELGMVDSIVDIVGTIYALHKLKIERLYSSPFVLGRGFARSLHGKIPIPAPATIALLKNKPIRFTDIEAELTTPTAAGLLSILVDEFLYPALTVEKIGYGIGKRKLSHPNLLRLIIGDEKKRCDTWVVEATIDDTNPEFHPFIIEKVMGAQALDAFFLPIVMKKGRIGTLFHVLVEKKNIEKIKDIMFQETSTLGVRFYPVERETINRKLEHVETCHGKIPVKIGVRRGEIITISPEYEVCKQIAIHKQVPIQAIYEEAMLVAHKIFKKRDGGC